MRRIVVGLVVVLVGAGFAGKLVDSSAVRVGSATLSSSMLRAELAVIATHLDFDCYLGPALVSQLISVPVRATGSQLSAATTAQWTNLQVNGVAVERYDELHNHWAPTASALATAVLPYESDLTNKAAEYSQSCSVTAAAAFTALPTWFRNVLLAEESASQVYTTDLKGTVPLTTAEFKSIFTNDPSAYETICVALVEVPDGPRVTAFLDAVHHGESIATLARTYSVDTSKSAGGNIGCYSATSSDYSAFSQYTSKLKLDHFPTTAQYDSGSDSYFVSPTRRTPTTFAKVETVILQQAESANATYASESIATLLHSSAVSVSPEFGRWSSSEVTVRELRLPAKTTEPNRGAGLGI